MADVNSTFKVYISTDPVFKVYVNNGAKGDSGIDGIDGQNGEGVASGGFTGQFLIKLSEEDFDTGWSNIDSTQVSYGDGTVSEGLDNRYTKGETDLLLSGKSNTSHTHDDRYFTETEVGVLLSGKSDTTHNHDLTYAPLVHNHDDIYYTDDEVDTLLLSKSDTTHTHDLIKNATEANAKIEASSTGAVITRNVNDANIALKVNQAQGTGNILTLQFGGANKLNVDKFGTILGVGLSNITNTNNSSIETLSTGIVATRNIADANPALIVNQANESSTGDIVKFQFGGVTKASVDKKGYIYSTVGIHSDVIVYTPSIANATNAYARIYFNTTGLVAQRNIGDAETCLKVNQANASSTGDIAQFQFAGTTQASITKFGQLKAPILLTSGGLAYTSSTDNAYFQTPVTGPVISRNVADTNPAVKVNLAHASSTGNIAEFQFNGTTKLAIDKNGLVPATNIANTPAGNISATTVQGAINELDTEKAPTVHTHDDRYYTETETNALLATKADKTQEAWITATLLNGATGELKYRKTTTELLEIYGSITVGTGTSGTSIAQLPTGYRPIPAYNPFRSLNNSTGGIVDLRISSSGVIQYATGMVTGHLIYFSVVLPL